MINLMCPNTRPRSAASRVVFKFDPAVLSDYVSGASLSKPPTAHAAPGLREGIGQPVLFVFSRLLRKRVDGHRRLGIRVTNLLATREFWVAGEPSASRVRESLRQLKAGDLVLVTEDRAGTGGVLADVRPCARLRGN